MSPLSLKDIPADDQSLLERIKGQVEANRAGHDSYVEARKNKDDAGMRYHKASFEAFEAYAQQFRDEADRLGVSADDVDADRATMSPAVDSQEETGDVPDKPDKQYEKQVLDAGIDTSGSDKK